MQEIDKGLTNFEDGNVNQRLESNKKAMVSTGGMNLQQKLSEGQQTSPQKPNNYTTSQVMDTTTRVDMHPNMNSSTVTNVRDDLAAKSESKSKGSFGNAGSLLGKLFKKKEPKEDDIMRQNSNDSSNVDITLLKGEARHLNLGPNKSYKSKVI